MSQNITVSAGPSGCALRDAIEENKVEPFADAGAFFADMPGAGDSAEGGDDGTQV